MKIYSELKAEQLKAEVCKILENLNLKYTTEKYSEIGSSIIDKGRRVDVVVLGDDEKVLMHIECKNQNTQGTTEDKLFKAVEEANRDKLHGIPSIIVFAGFGWSYQDARHALLNGSVRIELLYDWLKIFFKYKKVKPESITD